jgi:hypothetical protein
MKKLLACLSILAVGASGSWLGCDEDGRYTLSWRFEDAEITSAGVCAERGVEVIRVTVFRAGTNNQVAGHIEPCSPAEQSGPGLSSGTYDLKVEALRFDGRVFRHPETQEQLVFGWVENVRVREGKRSPASITLTRAPRCLDGVDNDDDRLVDALDPGCWQLNSKGEIVTDEQGDHIYEPLDDDETDPATPLGSEGS